jgi:hypothetical protein
MWKRKLMMILIAVSLVSVTMGSHLDCQIQIDEGDDCEFFCFD